MTQEITALRTFAHANFRIRVITRDGAPWFMAADVCRELDIRNPADALARLDGDEHTLVSTEGIPGAKNPQMRVLSESGLYALVQTSRKPEAKLFRRWINHEVLPSIRRTGSYSIQHQLEAPQHQIPQTYAEALRLAADLSDKVDEQAKQIEAAQPAIEFVDRYVAAKTTQSLRAVAKILGIQEQAFIARLESDKILYRLSGRLMPAADQMHKGHFEVKTGEVRGIAFAQPKVTPRGVEYLARCVARWQRDAQRS